MQLNSADVKLLIEGLQAWINAPLQSGLFGMLTSTALNRAEDDEKDFASFEQRITDRRKASEQERDGRARESTELLFKLKCLLEVAEKGGAKVQFTVSELLKLELALADWCHEAAQQEITSSIMQAMLFGKRSQSVRDGGKEMVRECTNVTQRRRMQACPTQYKLVMAINAASEHELGNVTSAG